MFAVALVVAGYVNRDRIRLKIASVYASVPPKASQGESRSAASKRSAWMLAPWVLSALPECLRQTYEASGTPSYVARRMPRGYTLQEPGTQLSYGDCALTVRASDVFVRRGKDRFYVPPQTQLYRRGDSIALLYEAGGRAVLRIYAPANLP